MSDATAFQIPQTEPNQLALRSTSASQIVAHAGLSRGAQQMSFHPTANVFPLLSDDELAALVKDIEEHGLRQPILLAEGKIADGRNRYIACNRAEVTPKFIEWDGKGSLVELVWSLNGLRRHLTPSQRAAVAIDMLPLLEKEAAERQKALAGSRPGRIADLTERIQQGGGEVEAKPKAAQKAKAKPNAKHNVTAAATAAKMTGTNAHYVADAKKLQAEEPDLFAAVKAGDITILQAKREVKEKAREARREDNRSKVEKAPSVDIFAGGAKFATVVIDPPWDWGDEGDVNQMGRAKPDYATMSIEEVAALNIPAVADVDCHLYLWITNRSLPKGFALLERWGFRYVTAVTWGKPSFGLGNYFRGQTEHVLFAVRGSQMLKRKDIGTLFLADRGTRHSEKPSSFYELVETCSPGPYLEMFSRHERVGWASWGESS